MKFLIQMNILTTNEELSDEGVGSDSEEDFDEKLIDTDKSRKTAESNHMKETQKMRHMAEGSLFQLN